MKGKCEINVDSRTHVCNGNVNITKSYCLKTDYYHIRDVRFTFSNIVHVCKPGEAKCPSRRALSGHVWMKICPWYENRGVMQVDFLKKNILKS